MLLDHEVFKNEGATPGPAKAHEWRDSNSTPTSVLDAMQELEAMQEGRAQIDADWAAAALPSPTVPPAAAEPLTPAPAPLPPTPLPVPPPPTNVAELRVTPCAELPLVSTVEGFATAAECESLIAAAHEVLASYDREPQPRERIPVAASSEARRLHARLHARLLSLIEAWPGDELRWATDLFGQGAGLSEMTFRYSAGEPAINIYTVGGEFAPQLGGSGAGCVGAGLGGQGLRLGFPSEFVGCFDRVRTIGRQETSSSAGSAGRTGVDMRQ
jgi:hypothetical protein